MLMRFQNSQELFDEFETYYMDRCSQCNGLVEVSIEHVRVEVEEKYIDIEEIPMLKCTKCGNVVHTHYAKCIILGAYSQLIKSENVGVVSKPNGFRKRYSYAEENEFIYDHRDYESIPGLEVDMEHSEKGFLTPVYFNRNALIYFVGDPNYKVDIFSESYGYMAKRDTQGYWEYEWGVPFGFNKNGKLVFWLGDLSTMDKFSRSLLKSFNQESDHLLIDSQFYQAQMNCIFSEPIKERQIIDNKEIFINNIRNKYSIDLAHLEEECNGHKSKVVRPRVFTEESITGTINALDKIIVEGFNVSELCKLYEFLYTS